MGEFSAWHWIIVLIVVLLLFGSGKLSALMGDFAHGIKVFKNTMRDDSHKLARESADRNQATPVDPAPPNARATDS